MERSGGVSTTYLAYLGLLVFTAVWTLASRFMVVGTVRAGDRAPTLGWAVQFWQVQRPPAREKHYDQQLCRTYAEHPLLINVRSVRL
jgi:hypothetical protein